METSQIIQNVQMIIRRYLPEEKWSIVLFGSQAQGTAQKTSDIDIGIMGEEPVSWETLIEIKNDIKTIRTLRKIDVVDLLATDQNFRDGVLKHAKALM